MIFLPDPLDAPPVISDDDVFFNDPVVFDFVTNDSTMLLITVT